TVRTDMVRMAASIRPSISLSNSCSPPSRPLYSSFRLGGHSPDDACRLDSIHNPLYQSLTRRSPYSMSDIPEEHPSLSSLEAGRRSPFLPPGPWSPSLFRRGRPHLEVHSS